MYDHKSTNIHKKPKIQRKIYHKSQKYKEKIKMVYLCVQAWL